MARKTDKTSTRQQAFDWLDDVVGNINRTDAVNELKNKFNIQDGYANTLYQSHKTDRVNKGSIFKTAFSIKEDNNQNPFIYQTKVPKLLENQANTIEGAINKYIIKNEERIVCARLLFDIHKGDLDQINC